MKIGFSTEKEVNLPSHYKMMQISSDAEFEWIIGLMRANEELEFHSDLVSTSLLKVEGKIGDYAVEFINGKMRGPAYLHDLTEDIVETCIKSIRDSDLEEIILIGYSFGIGNLFSPGILLDMVIDNLKETSKNVIITLSSGFSELKEFLEERVKSQNIEIIR